MDPSRLDARRALLKSAADRLYDAFDAIGRDTVEATKVERAAALLAGSPPEVGALVMLAALASLREHEDTIAVYESLLAKLKRGLMEESDLSS